MLRHQRKIEDLQKVELINIVRSLLKFVVIESKTFFVEDADKKEYIKGYLYMISKSLNGASPIINMQSIHDQIEEDLFLVFKS